MELYGAVVYPGSIFLTLIVVGHYWLELSADGWNS